MVRLERSIGLEAKRPLSQSKIMRNTGVTIRVGGLQAFITAFQRSNLEKSTRHIAISSPLSFQVIRPAGLRPVISVPFPSRRRLNIALRQFLGG